MSLIKQALIRARECPHNFGDICLLTATTCVIIQNLSGGDANAQIARQPNTTASEKHQNEREET